MYSNCCCRCSFESEIIKMGQSPHKMYSNNIVKSGNLLNAPRDYREVVTKAMKVLVTLRYPTRKGTEFKSCTKQLAFHMALIL